MLGSAAASPVAAAGGGVIDGIAAVAASGAPGSCPARAGVSTDASSSGEVWRTRAGSNSGSDVPMGAAVVALRNNGACGATTVVAAGTVAFDPGAALTGATWVIAGFAGILVAADGVGARVGVR